MADDDAPMTIKARVSVTVDSAQSAPAAAPSVCVPCMVKAALAGLDKLMHGSPAEMSPKERVAAAVVRAVPLVGHETLAKLKEMVSPESLKVIGGVGGVLGALWIASQFTPVGWAADLVGGALLVGTVAVAAVGALLMGYDLGTGVNDIIDGLSKASAAQSSTELHAASQAIAKGTAAVSVDIGTAVAGEGIVKLASKGAEAAGLPEALNRLKAGSSSSGVEITPDPGSEFQRDRLATQFYQENGKPPEDIMSHRDGIDKTKPVVVKMMQPGETVVRWEFPDRGMQPGKGDTYASFPGEDPEKMGIVTSRPDKTVVNVSTKPENLGVEEVSPANTAQAIKRVPVTYTVTKPTLVLESTAADLKTPAGAPTVGGKGGARQAWIPDTSGLVKK